TKLVPREPLAGIGLMVGAACGGGGGAVLTGVAGATVGAVVGAGAGVLAPVEPVAPVVPGAPVAPVAPMRIVGGAAAGGVRTSHPVKSTAARARPAMSFDMRPR